MGEYAAFDFQYDAAVMDKTKWCATCPTQSADGAK